MMLKNKTLNKAAYFLILIHSQSHMVVSHETWDRLFAEQKACLQQKKGEIHEGYPYIYWKVSEYYLEKQNAIIAMHKTIEAATQDAFHLQKSSNIIGLALAMRTVGVAEKTTYVEDLVSAGLSLVKQGRAARENFDLGIFLGLDILAQKGALKFDADILHPEQNLQISRRDFDRIIYALIIVNPICEEPSFCLKKIKLGVLETLASQLLEASKSLGCSAVEVRNMNKCLSRHLPHLP